MRLGAFMVVEPDRATADVLSSLCRRLRTAVVVDSLEAARGVLARRPALTAVVLDVALPDGCGAELVEELRVDYPLLPVLVLTARTTPEVINRTHALRAEFHAKPTRRSALAGFFRRAVAFERVPNERVAWLVEETVRRYNLSPRETDLLAAAVAGTTRKELCDQLGTTENTLKSVAKGALRKLGQASLDGVAREILRQALDGSGVAGLPQPLPTPGTAAASGPLTIQPPKSS
ncbi:MAG: response regulator [Myxococcota bacterium]